MQQVLIVRTLLYHSPIQEQFAEMSSASQLGRDTFCHEMGSGYTNNVHAGAARNRMDENAKTQRRQDIYLIASLRLCVDLFSE